MSSSAFFESVENFPSIENGVIDTTAFLTSAKSIVQFIELLGVAFKPVRDDISGNIVKISAVYEKDPVKFSTLNAILQHEADTIPSGSFKIGTDALLWLYRALYYNQLFLTDFLLDLERSETESQLTALPETLSPHFKSAYDRSLKCHHNWLVQGIFSLCLHAAPSRSSLLSTLGYTKDSKLDLTARVRIMNSLSPYLSSLSVCNAAISSLLLSHGFTP